jgi:hypothetical protein
MAQIEAKKIGIQKSPFSEGISNNSHNSLQTSAYHNTTQRVPALLEKKRSS